MNIPTIRHKRVQPDVETRIPLIEERLNVSKSVHLHQKQQ